MQFSDLEKELSILEAKNNSHLIRERGINADTFDFSVLEKALLEGVFDYIDDEAQYRLKYIFETLFNGEDYSPELIHRVDLLNAVDVIFFKIDELSVTDNFFFEVFNDNSFQEKDRLKAVLKGENAVIVSKSEVNEALLLFKKIFKNVILEHFNLLTYKEALWLNTPYILELFLFKQTSFSSAYSQRSFFLHLSYFSLTDEFKETLFNWHQENNCVLFVEKDIFSFDDLVTLSYLLTNEQKKHVLSIFKKQCVARFNYMIKNNEKSGTYSSVVTSDIETIRKQLQEIKSYEENL